LKDYKDLKDYMDTERENNFGVSIRITPYALRITPYALRSTPCVSSWLISVVYYIIFILERSLLI